MVWNLPGYILEHKEHVSSKRYFSLCYPSKSKFFSFERVLIIYQWLVDGMCSWWSKMNSGWLKIKIWQFLVEIGTNWDIKRVIVDRILKFAKMQQAWTFYRYFSVEITFGFVVIDFVWTWGQKQILFTKFCQSVPVDAWTEKFL